MTIRIRLFSLIFALLVPPGAGGCVASQSYDQLEHPAQAVSVEIRTAPDQLKPALCMADTVVASPTGRHVALFDSSTFGKPSRFASRFALSSDVVSVISDACFARGGECDPLLWRTRMPPVALTWSVDETSLFAVDREVALAELPLRQTQAAVDWTPSNASARNVRVSLSYAGPSESRTLGQERERVDSSLAWMSDSIGDAREVSLTLRTSGPLAHAAILDRDFVWHRLDIATGSVSARGLDHPLFPMLRPQLDAAGRSEFAAAGAVFDRELRAQRAPYYALPILDARTGRRIGMHDERVLYLSEGDRRLVLDVGRGWRLESASRVGNEGRLYALVRDFSGDRILVLLGEENVGLRAECNWTEQNSRFLSELGLSELGLSARRGEDSDYEVVVRARNGHDLPLRRYRPEAPNRRLAVYFRGGPSGNLAHSPNASLGGLLSLGFDVIAPDYSGATGVSADLAGRLAAMGPEAIARDVEVTMQYVDQLMAAEFDECLIYGESFGALHAVLAARRHPQACDTIVLVVPWLKHREPRTWTRSSPNGGFEPAYQEFTERVLIGIHNEEATDAFRQWQEGLRSNPLHGRNILVFFAERDQVSSPEDLMPLEGENVSIVTVPGTTHSTIIWRNGDLGST